MATVIASGSLPWLRIGKAEVSAFVPAAVCTATVTM